MRGALIRLGRQLMFLSLNYVSFMAGKRFNILCTYFMKEFVQLTKKVRKTTPASLSTSKFGLTEAQTDGMMGEELHLPDTTNKSAEKVGFAHYSFASP